MKRTNFISLAILAVVTSFYSLTENSWFNSWTSGVIGSSNFETMVMVSTSAGMGAAFFLIWGAISDNIRTKFGRRKPVLLTGLVLSAIFIFMFAGSKEFIACLILDGIVLGITGNMMWSSWHSLIADLSKPKTRGKLVSNLFIFASIGGLLLTVIEIVAETDERGFFTEATHLFIFYLTAISMLVAAFILFFTLKEVPMIKLPPKRRWYIDLKNIFDAEELKSHKEFYKFLLAAIVLTCAKYAYVPLLIVFRQEKGFDSFQRLISYIIMGVGTFIGTFLLARISDKYGRRNIIIYSIPGAILGLILSAMIDLSFEVFLIGYSILFFFFEGITKTQETWAQDLADEEARGKFLGLANISQTLGRIPGLLLAGIFADIIGINAIFIVSAIIVVFSIPLFLRVKDVVLNEQKKINK